MIFAKNFARNYEKKILEHQTFGRWDDHPIDLATQRNIQKFVGFKLRHAGAHCKTSLEVTLKFSSWSGSKQKKVGNAARANW